MAIDVNAPISGGPISRRCVPGRFPIAAPPRLQRYFAFALDHKVIGVQYLTTFVVLFLLAGFLAVLMRMELIDSGETIMGANDFNTTMSLHGIIMVAVAVATIIGGFAISPSRSLSGPRTWPSRASTP